MSGIRAFLPESSALPAGFGGQNWIGPRWDQIHCPPMSGAVVFMVRQRGMRRHLADRLPADLPRIDVPTLMVHGTEDRILPIDSTPDDYPS
jgi:pimeloyl-ACP methyl ester carboxylesterase